MTALCWSLLFCAFIYFLLLVYPCARRLNALILSISPFSAFPLLERNYNNVLSSGLPLPAPGLSGAVLLSAGRPEEWGAGPVLVRFSVQPVPRISCIHSHGQRILQPSALLNRSGHGIPVLHGKQPCCGCRAVAIHKSLFLIGMHEYCMIARL